MTASCPSGKHAVYCHPGGRKVIVCGCKDSEDQMPADTPDLTPETLAGLEQAVRHYGQAILTERLTLQLVAAARDRDRLADAVKANEAALSAIDYALGEPNEMNCSMYDVDKHEGRVVEKVQRLAAELALWKPMTPAEAEKALDEAEGAPLSEERIREMVKFATDPANSLDNSQQAQLVAANKRLAAELAEAKAVIAALEEQARGKGYRAFSERMNQLAGMVVKVKKELAEAKREWQPISTAPKDRHILASACDELDHRFVVEAWWSDLNFGGWLCVLGCGPVEDIGEPTHWMPLPEPPTASRTSAGAGDSTGPTTTNAGERG